MNLLLEVLSMSSGLVPWNRLSRNSYVWLDYSLMVMVPTFYLTCYFLANFGGFGVHHELHCDNVCRLAYSLFIHLGCLLYVATQILTLWRGKRFFMEFQRCLQGIDEDLVRCHLLISQTSPKRYLHSNLYYLTWLVVFACFSFTLFNDIKEMINYYGELFFIYTTLTTFPYLVSSVILGQFISFVSAVSDRFEDVNYLFEKISEDNGSDNPSSAAFDIEPKVKKKDPHSAWTKKQWRYRRASPDFEMMASGDNGDGASTAVSNEHCFETVLTTLFTLHDKILSLSVLTNGEYGPQCAPYMAVCFVITIFGIFLETKVAFVVGGRNRLLDYTVFLYIVWSVTTILVSYLTLHMCSKANGQSKQSAMIVHEIMQKKPPFMLGNDLYYNKIKSFTLQFLHWERYFHYNVIGLYALDYTFIFSTISAATSYLIVLLQFDMTAILKSEGLL